VKRAAVALSIALALLFSVVAISKDRPTKTVDLADTSVLTQARRDSIQQFWRHYRTATQHRVSGQLRQAAAEYAQALALNSEHRDALYYLGNVRFELGEFREAERAWLQLASIDPPRSRVFQRLGDLYSCVEQDEFFDPTQARAAFSRALEINSEETGPLLRLGQLALVEDQSDTALHYLDAVTATNDRSVPAFFFKGYIAWRRGQPDIAVEMFRTAARNHKPTEPTEGASKEGDTESGKAILAKTTQCQSLQSYAEDLPDPEDPDLHRLMDERYRKLAEFLRQTDGRHER
jgi:tetratricopeptide (TPR) repeat protein